MKKFFAILCVFATVFAFASCKKELTPEEVSASIEAARSEAKAANESKIAASIKQEEIIVENKAETLESLGKTVTGEKIVFKSSSQNTQYDVVFFDANGKAESWKRYNYYSDAESFDLALKNVEGANFTFVSSDRALRLIVTENTNYATYKGTAFNTVLKNIKDFGYTVIE